MAMRSILALPRRRVWTFADLDDLPRDGVRYEIIDGELLVTPMPSFRHQRAAIGCAVLFELWCREHVRWAVCSPGGVYVTETTWLEPDLAVYPVDPDADIPWPQLATPLLVIEILSQSTASRDRVRKRPIYLAHGVREVWLADRVSRTIERWTAGAEQPVLEQGSSIWHPDPSLPALTIPHETVFGAAAV
jgi:Uma2 family endonuclease